MPDTTQLADLRDIHLPEAVSAWPPGPGYYALIALFIICILIYMKYKKHQQYTAPKRQALTELTRIEANYKKNLHAKSTAAAINILLKQVALVYHPRIDVASLHGQAWLKFLQKTSCNINFEATQASLLETPFNPDSTEDLNPLFSATQNWIKQRRKRCLN
ncbi:MAG: DUF4381 domain-containing protein [Legionella sp.]|nr:DUF4381 domain-containing protein [Legionella sp.]